MASFTRMVFVLLGFWFIGQTHTFVFVAAVLKHNCSEYVTLGAALNCKCVLPYGEDGHAQWNHSGTEILFLPSVSKEDNGTGYVCRKVNGADTITYTLKVAQGPDAGSTKISSSLPQFTTEHVLKETPITLTCRSNDTYPPPTLTWLDAPCMEGPDGSTCTWVPVNAENGTTVRCRATETTGTSQPRTDETSFTLVILEPGQVTSPVPTTHNPTDNDNGEGGNSTSPSGVIVSKGNMRVVTLFVISVFIVSPP